MPNFEGIALKSRARSATDYDEASSYLKYSLCQIELDRQTAITERFDREGKIKKGTMPDIWKPLREMTHNLMPHLRFHKIDVTNRDQVQCLWEVHTKAIHVDIDELSSGEKAVIQLFFPLIENRILARIERSKGGDVEDAQTPQSEEVCVLMDEPELHLHPNLQGKILDYLRNLSIREHVQFILATHSPTIVEQASSEELFLLRPSELVPTEENQLLQIATDDEKLQVLRDVFGSTSNITAMRNILVVEGQKPTDNSKKAADQRILSFLSERFSQLTIRSGGGKSECKSLAESLSDILSDEFSKNLRAHALVDRDLEEGKPTTPGVHYLPVSMIENLLVDPEVIWKAITTVHHKISLTDQAAVDVALDIIVDEMEDHEKARRVKAEVGLHAFRLQDPIDTATDQAEQFMQTLQASVSPEAIGAASATAEANVVRLKKTNQRREYFDGKKLLDEFYRQHLHGTGMSKEIFVYECARCAADRNVVKRFVDELFDSIAPA
ncbi:MAG: AAA family ATPase [Gammaproteobacteria bacterium]|nr:AAA family ATPase [Gammaproteobacteria bacterium]